jgi:hypothetical protein
MGFKVPGDLRETADILNISVGTDSVLATQTRRGTGFHQALWGNPHEELIPSGTKECA